MKKYFSLIVFFFLLLPSLVYAEPAYAPADLMNFWGFVVIVLSFFIWFPSLIASFILFKESKKLSIALFLLSLIFFIISVGMYNFLDS